MVALALLGLAGVLLALAFEERPVVPERKRRRLAEPSRN
jgi:hypothetical protein